MHEALAEHRSQELPSLAHHVVPLHQVQTVAVEPAQRVDVLAVGRGHRREGAPAGVHRLHLYPLLLAQIEFLHSVQVLLAIIATDRINAIRESHAGQGTAGLIHLGKQLPLALVEVIALCCAEAVGLVLAGAFTCFHGRVLFALATAIATNSIHHAVRAQRNSQLVSLLHHVGEARPLAFLEVQAVKLPQHSATISAAEEDLAFVAFDTRREARARLRHLERECLELVGFEVVLFDLAGALAIDLLASKEQNSGLGNSNCRELGAWLGNAGNFLPDTALNIKGLATEKLGVVET